MANSLIYILLKLSYYSYLITSIIGLITNLIAFVIFSRKNYQNTVFSIYYRFLTLFCFLSSLIIPISKYFEFNFEISFWLDNDVLCKFRMFTFYSIQPVLGWGLVVISIDRYFSIACPFIFLIRKNKIFQITVCCGVIVYNLIYNSPFLFFYIKTKINFNNQTNQTNIIKSCTNDFYQKDWFNLFNLCIIPFCLMFIFSLLTSSFIFKSRTLHNRNYSSSTKKRDIRFAVSSIVTNLIFLLLNLPHAFYIILINVLSYKINDKNIQNLILSIFYFFSYLSSSSVFFINLILSLKFRNEFKRMFRLK